MAYVHVPRSSASLAAKFSIQTQLVCDKFALIFSHRMLNGLPGTAPRRKAKEKGEKIYFTLWHMLNQLSRQMFNITEGNSVVEGCRSLKQKRTPWLDFLHRRYSVSSCAEITRSKGVVKEMTLAATGVPCTVCTLGFGHKLGVLVNILLWKLLQRNR